VVKSIDTKVIIKHDKQMEQIILKDKEDTEKFGQSFASDLKAGAVIALTGPLGAGKTTLTKSIAKGLGVSETITSPTFTIVCEYETGRLPLYHFDVYRVHDEEDLFEMGFEEYFHKGGVCLIEWADLVEDLLPDDTLRIELDYGEEENQRTLKITPYFPDRI